MFIIYISEPLFFQNSGVVRKKVFYLGFKCLISRTVFRISIFVTDMKQKTVTELIIHCILHVLTQILQLSIFFPL